MDDPKRHAASARSAWAALNQTGGAITRPELQERWNLSRQRVHTITSGHDFPAPVIEGTTGQAAVWLTAAVERWRRTWKPLRGPANPHKPLMDTDTEPDLNAARGAWSAVTRAGGLVTARELAEQWGITYRAAGLRLATDGCPEPVLPGRWLAAEIHEWQQRNYR